MQQCQFPTLTPQLLGAGERDTGGLWVQPLASGQSTETTAQSQQGLTGADTSTTTLVLAPPRAPVLCSCRGCPVSPGTEELKGTVMHRGHPQSALSPPGERLYFMGDPPDPTLGAVGTPQALRAGKQA